MADPVIAPPKFPLNGERERKMMNSLISLPFETTLLPHRKVYTHVV